MKIKVLLLFLLIPLSLFAQTNREQIILNDSRKSKLVAGIVVDQMRYDYLAKYYDKFYEYGFKKLIRGGFNIFITNN